MSTPVKTMQSARTLWRHGVQRDPKARYRTESPSPRRTVTHHHSADLPQKHDLAYVPDLTKLMGGASIGYAVAAAYRKNMAAGLTKSTPSPVKTDLSTTDVVRHFSMDSCFTA